MLIILLEWIFRSIFLFFLVIPLLWFVREYVILKIRDELNHFQLIFYTYYPYRTSYNIYFFSFFIRFFGISSDFHFEAIRFPLNDRINAIYDDLKIKSSIYNIGTS